MSCTWNPSDIGSSVALSLGNLKWTSSNSGQVCGRATLGYLANSGVKLYYEQTVDVQGSSSAQGFEMDRTDEARANDARPQLIDLLL